MCNQIYRLILKVTNFLKSKCCFTCCFCCNGRDKNSLSSFQNIYQNCCDRPYGILSFELLVQIRMFLESTRNPIQKEYLRLLENFIKILDYLCHANSRSLLIKYINHINEMKSSEIMGKYKSLLSLTLSALKLSLKRINKNFTSETLLRRILSLEKVIINFGLIHDQDKFIEIFCNILNKLPKLALIRRGVLKTKKSISYD